MNPTKLAQTYLYLKDKMYFISTINRKSSAMSETELWYAETIVWELDLETKEKKQIVHQDGDARDSIDTHLTITNILFSFGPSSL